MSSLVPAAEIPPPPTPPPSDIELLRETVTMLALSGRSFESIEAILTSDAEQRAAHLDNHYQQRIFGARTRMGETETQIRDVDAAVEKARTATVQQVDLEHQKRNVDRRIEVLKVDIKRKREALEREKHKAAVDEAARRLQHTREKLSDQRKQALAEQMATWQRQREEDERRADIESQALAETERALSAARERVKPLLDQRITKTVAGFLLWVGYGSFAAIGATIALLLPKIDEGHSPLAQIIGAIRSLVGGQAETPAWMVLAGSIGFLLMVVGGFAAIVWLNDWTLQRFDSDWRSEARRWRRRKNEKNDRGRSEVTFQPVEIRRTSYVQLLAALPYILITGALVCLLSVADGPAPATLSLAGMPQNTASPNSVSSSIVGTYLGTVVALLMTASFALYIVKIIGPREESNENESAQQRRKRWFRGWEFLLIPFMAVVGVIYVTATAPENRREWGFLAIFMLLSCLAVAYGVIYRGLFYDVDRLERDRRRSLKVISDLRAFEQRELDATPDILESEESLQREREELDELQTFRWPGLHEEPEPDRRSFLRRIRPKRPPRFSAQAFAVSESDAAGAELNDLKALHEDLANIDRQLAAVRIDSEGVDLKALATRRDELLRELGERRAAAETLEFERRGAVYELRSRHELQMLDLRGVFEMAVAARPFMPPTRFDGVPK